MSSSVAQRLPKPDWNNVQRYDTYKNIFLSCGISALSGLIAYFGWYAPKWKAIEEYERNYDPFAEMERMRNLGLFSSCPPDYVIEERKQKELAKKNKK